jgi:hypothetical protein
VSDKTCPSEAELVSFVDVALSPEELRRIEKHLEVCSSCAKRALALSELTADVAADLPQPHFDMAEHVAGVMRRLDEPALQAPRGRWIALAGALAVAAAVVLLVATRGQAPEQSRFAARGSGAVASLSRDVGLQLYAQETELRPLASGAAIRPETALTAGLRNLGSQQAYLLLFAIDARQQVHWIAPEFAAPGSNPESTSIAASQSERLLPSAAVFDDLAPGPLRVVAVITARPTHVADVEALNANQLDDAGLLARFPQAEIRQALLQVGGAKP